MSKKTPMTHAVGTGRLPVLRSDQKGQVPIVGVGASAGGIEAVSDLLRRLPSDSGLAFVIIQHLAPQRPSMLRSVLARSTAMPVVEATNGLCPVANHVYVIPPGVEMALVDHALVVGAPEETRRTHQSIDLFLRSLAHEEESRAIGVLLSGTGSDGTEGLLAIRAAGGIALVEDPSAAKFPAMPESAIAAGAADRVLSIERLAEELVELSRSPYLRSPEAPAGLDSPAAGEEESEQLQRVFGLVRAMCGVDFAEYKATTFRRRLARRMMLRRSGTLADYLALLASEPAEVEALARDILIHVTEFFRDPEAFSALRSSVIPRILERHSDGSPIRVWVPGCSTGEETYSIAMSLLEALGDKGDSGPIQIFGTDLSSEMIDRARAAVYPESAVRSLEPGHLERFFTQVEGGYRVVKAVRSMCVFVRHDLTRDPPFAHLDLISCRNVLIYFSAALQRRVVPLFHYCLDPGGFLLLGQAEAIAGFPEMFATVDKTNKLFAKIGTSRTFGALPAGRERPIAGRAGTGVLQGPVLAASGDVRRQAENLILGRYAPPGALVDERMDIIHLRGKTAPYLELGPGEPELNLAKMTHESLLPALRSAFQEARKERVTVRREGVEFRTAEGLDRVDIEVIPVTGVPARERYFLVLFDRATDLPADRRRAGKRRPATGPDDHELEIRRLREEAEATRDFLQSVLDERQRMNDEVTATNEELQSINEELEAAREELQSSNEELSNVNDELELRNRDVNLVNSDLLNLIASVDIPIVMVSGDGRVRRFTPGAKALMNLIPSDIGRPLDDIKLNVDVRDINGLMTEVLDTLAIKELEVQDRAGRWFRMQIRPYRTVDGKIDGVVLSLTDIDDLKHAVGDATDAFDQVKAILETIRVPVIVLDDRLRLRYANRAYCEAFADPEAPVGLDWLATCGRAWDRPELRSSLERLLTRGGDMAIDVEMEHPAGAHRTLIVAASVLRWAHDTPLLLLTPVDVTESSRLLQVAEDARAEAERANRAKDVFLAMVSHELRAPLQTITLHADLLLFRATSDRAATVRVAEAIGRAAMAQDQIIRDLLDVSAIIAGKIQIQRDPVELRAVIVEALDSVRDSAAKKGIDLHVAIADPVGPIMGQASRLVQIVVNLLSNAVKFTPVGGQVTVQLEQVHGRARIQVRDTGQGIAAEFLPHVFARFAQADTSTKRIHRGLGLGLAIVQDLVRLHGGDVGVASDGVGRGTVVTVDLPLVAPPG